MQLFILTIRFLTRIPLPLKNNEIISEEEFSKGIIFYPIIGFIVGIINFIIFNLIFFLTSSILISSIFFVLSNILVTGAFHIDGLADSYDGLYSSRKKERILEIMKDSRIGTNGALAILFDIILKISIVYFIGKEFDIIHCIIIIILSPVAGKMVIPIFLMSKYARNKNGLGSIYLKNQNIFINIFTIISGFLIINIFIKSYSYLIIILTCTISAILFKKHCENIIDGMTGDTFGAGFELIEIIFMMCYLVLLNFNIISGG